MLEALGLEALGLEALDQRLRTARRRFLKQTRLDRLLEERQSRSDSQPMFFI